MITTDNETYVPTKDEDGNDYLCPVDGAGSDGRVASTDTDTCIEAEVAGRYAGFING